MPVVYLILLASYLDFLRELFGLLNSGDCQGIRIDHVAVAAIGVARFLHSITPGEK